MSEGRPGAPEGLIAPRSPDWPRAARALTTTRDGIVVAPDRSAGRGFSEGAFARLNLAAHVGDDPRAVAANRRELAATIGIERIQWLNQIHGTQCIEASLQTAATLPDADAAWTAVRGLGLAVLTADCVPAVLSDRRGTLIAVAHAGWRGLVAGVLDRVVKALAAEPSELVAWLGPAIGPAAYEVGPEVADAIAALPNGDVLSRACTRPAGAAQKYRVDLFTLAEQLLRQAGVPLVVSERLCTWSDARFYSYRRDGATGRMATVAWLE